MPFRRPHAFSRNRLQKATERRAFHIGVVCLVILDLSVVVTAVVLELTHPHCSRVVEDKLLSAAAAEPERKPRFKVVKEEHGESNSTAAQHTDAPEPVSFSKHDLDPPPAVRRAA